MFDTIIPTAGLDLQSGLICTAVSLVLGALSALIYRLGNKKPSKSLILTLVVLPALVQAVIMLVNGSVGAGLAVMGAFNLVRFRSAPGSAKDICFIFYAVCMGLACGMGYIGFAVFLAVVVGAVLAVSNLFPFFRQNEKRRLLRIVVPESLDYTGAFDDIFEKYLAEAELTQVKTTAMGTLFDLRYTVILKENANQKELFDLIRARNGNLTISLGELPQTSDQL